MTYKYLALLGLFLLMGFVSSAQKNVKTETFKVAGSCAMCKDRIEKAVLKGKAQKAQWNQSSGLLTLSYDSTQFQLESFQQILANAGHDNGLFKAPESIYKALPACCHYSRQEGAELTKTIHTITGVVLEEDKKGHIHPIARATVKSLHSDEYFITDSTGVFRIQSDLPTHIAISYVGFESDTISVVSPEMLTIILKSGASGQLKEVVVQSRPSSTYVSSLSILNTLNMGSRELTKAACCNVSESFETSPSVDVNYSDAVTGVKQIQLLGLSGNYTQLLTENVPEIKGLAAHYGMTYVPGPWVENIQLTKGIGSVVNGYESIAGQINLEEKKPDHTDRLFLNLYGNNMGRMEANLNVSQKINDKWSVGLLTHGNYTGTKRDDNKDGFLDGPLGHQWNVMNRWRYADNNGWMGQLMIKAVNDHRQAGQMDFNPATDKGTTRHYGVGIETAQYIVSGKLGYIFPHHKYKSLGLIFSANSFQNDSYFGLTQYQSKQQSLFANLIYQSIIGTTDHKFRTGLSFSNEQYEENLNTAPFNRHEIVPGAFFEYTYVASDKFTAVAGIRADQHNLYGLITTPRLHLKYDMDAKTNLRFSGGSGFRVNNIFAENMGVFVSSRKYQILDQNGKQGYGLNPEKAWNYGLNFMHQFKWNHRNGSISLDVYQTRFENRTITDLDADPRSILFYNLDGKSISNNFQAEVNYELLKKLDLRMAYRWLEVQNTYQGKILDQPFTAKHRAFINLAYETNNKWRFDYTVQWLSKKRIPHTTSNPIEWQLPSYSPAYFQMAAQVSKTIHKQWDLYLGSENLTNYTQHLRVLDAAHPFGNYFDGSMVWGPVSDRTIYAGLRFTIR